MPGVLFEWAQRQKGRKKRERRGGGGGGGKESETKTTKEVWKERASERGR